MRSWVIKLWAMAGGLLVIAMLGASLFGADGVTRHERLRAELEQVNQLNGELAVENRRLAIEARALRHDPRYIEATIREELGWVRSDELIFIFPAGQAKR
jgi:cell division protein FtsB